MGAVTTRKDVVHVQHIRYLAPTLICSQIVQVLNMENIWYSILTHIIIYNDWYLSIMVYSERTSTHWAAADDHLLLVFSHLFFHGCIDCDVRNIAKPGCSHRTPFCMIFSYSLVHNYLKKNIVSFWWNIYPRPWVFEMLKEIQSCLLGFKTLHPVQICYLKCINNRT